MRRVDRRSVVTRPTGEVDVIETGLRDVGAAERMRASEEDDQDAGSARSIAGARVKDSSQITSSPGSRSRGSGGDEARHSHLVIMEKHAYGLVGTPKRWCRVTANVGVRFAARLAQRALYRGMQGRRDEMARGLRCRRYSRTGGVQ